MSPRYRLAHPVTTLRRGPEVLQVGLDAAAAVLLPGAPPEADRFVHAFTQASSVADVTRLLPDLHRSWAAHAAALLQAAGLLVEVSPRPREPPLVVVGGGVLAERIVRLLLGAGVESLVVVEQPEADAEARLARSRFWAGIDRSGQRPRLRVTDDWQAPVSQGSPLVVIAPSTIEPDRGLTDALRRRGQRHLVVRCEPERAVVGPWVDPTPASCVRCIDLRRRDTDRDWPLMLAQLCRTLHTPGTLGLTWAASSAVAQVLAWRSGGVPDAVGATVELSLETYALECRPWLPHTACGCGQLW